LGCSQIMWAHSHLIWSQGPSYSHSMWSGNERCFCARRFMFSGRYTYEDGPTHPADDARREGIASILRLAGDGLAANEIDLSWNDLKRLSPSSEAPGYAKRYPTRLLVKLADCIFNACANAGFHPFADQQREAQTLVSRTLAEAWREFHQDAAEFSKFETLAIASLKRGLLTA
jgi:hypothetical protein